ncbi:hypothetical protein MMC32_003414 [Xylographa parallela]|nr:hypothetical protein [Xylographa parallela]
MAIARYRTPWILLLFVVRTIASATFAINGVHAGVNVLTGQRPFRQEFSIFQNAGPAFDLYIQALQQLAQTNQSAMLSYYAVAGIHGYPNMPWDGVLGDNTGAIGYCTHSSVLFPTWHRPYVALYEQLLHANARSIAATYNSTNGATYRAAAETFRIPYWDWSLNPTMPGLVNAPTLTITTPTGVRAVPNPLYNYTFNPLPTSPDFPEGDSVCGLIRHYGDTGDFLTSLQVSQFLSTVRYPTSLDPNATSQPGKVNKQLQANAESLHDLTYQLLASEPNYTNFTSSAFSHGNSLENVHNIIHALVGNGGHMAYLPYSSFDPIFWLHHAQANPHSPPFPDNVDRLTTIWQALYPTSFTSPEADAYGTFTNPPNGIEDTNTPLTPFHASANGTLYTSTTVRTTRTFGYAYPEVQDWNATAAQLAATVRATVNSLYNPASATRKRAPPGQSASKRAANANAAAYQWAINIAADVTRLPTPLLLHFFLSAPPPSPQAWSSAPNLIASLPLLSTPIQDLSTTSTPPPPPPRLTHGQLPLTHALLRLPVSQLPDLAPASVLPLLRTALQWRAQRFDGGVVAGGEAAEVRVVGRPVRVGEGVQRFPAYGAWEEWVWEGGGEGGL